MFTVTTIQVEFALTPQIITAATNEAETTRRWLEFCLTIGHVKTEIHQVPTQSYGNQKN